MDDEDALCNVQGGEEACMLGQCRSPDNNTDADIQNLEEKLRQLQVELDECRSLVTIAECQKENAIETEQRKCRDEVASMQRIMEESVEDAVRTSTGRFEKEMSQLQKANEKLKNELGELKVQLNRDRTDFTREGVLAAVTKSLKRVGNLSGQFVSNADGVENLEDSMKKPERVARGSHPHSTMDQSPRLVPFQAQEDAEVLSSLIVPLEEEIKALKDKLRSTDEQLQSYEAAFYGLVKSLGCDSLLDMIKGKSPMEVVEHLDEKLSSLSQRLQAEKASRTDLETYVAVLNTQKTVMQKDMDRIKTELQEVCHLLEKEKEDHGSLKRTWQMANDQFLETQRLQTMDMLRIQSVLTSEQQRQIAELKRKDEERLEIQKQIQKVEKSDSLEKSSEGNDHSSPLAQRPSSSKSLKSSPRLHRRLPSNQSWLSEDMDFLSPNSARAQSIPANLNQAGEDALTEKRSLSSSALSKLADEELKNSTFIPIHSPPVKEEPSSTPQKLPSLTQDQLEALSDLTPELEDRKTLIDNARAETEILSLVGKRLVSETEWQLLEAELKKAREKFGQPCEMCCNYELQLQQVQRLEQEQRQKAITIEQTLEGYKKDLQREKGYRMEMEEKFNDAAKECEQKVSSAFKVHEDMIKHFSQKKSEYEAFQKFREYHENINHEKEKWKTELAKLRRDNEHLLGKHLAKAQDMRNKEIQLPNSIEELQFYCLQQQEELITSTAAKESVEENLKSEIQMLKSQLMSEQTSKESLEETLMQEIDSLREQLGIAESEKTELETQKSQNQELLLQVQALKKEISEKEKKIGVLQTKLEELESTKVNLDEELQELKSKIQSLQLNLDNSEAVQKNFVKLSQSLQMELEKIRQSDCEVRWQHEDDVVECNSCKKIFQHRKEKSHCNHCGKIFCLDCISKSVCSGPKQRQFRVCNVCHTLLDHQTAPYFSSEPPHSPT